MGNSDRGICATAPRGDRRHCKQCQRTEGNNMDTIIMKKALRGDANTARWLS